MFCGALFSLYVHALGCNMKSFLWIMVKKSLPHVYNDQFSDIIKLFMRKNFKYT